MTSSFDTEKFILEIQNRPCLWDSAIPEYSDRNLKSKSWEEIANLFKEKDEMTARDRKQLVESLQKRWKSIRGCYTRELNRQKYVNSGFSPGSRKSEYIYFKQLQFLQNVVTLREPDPLAVTADLVTTSLDNPDDSEKDEPTTSRKRQKKESDDDEFITVVNRSTDNTMKDEINNEDEDRLFLLSLVKTLKKVPEHRKMATKIRIMSILEEETRPVPNETTYAWP